jgi:protein arginine kinase
LKAGMVLHLPGLAMAGDTARIGPELAESRHDFKPLLPSRNEALGDLYVIENACTLGRSEEETLFHLKHLAADLITRERDARARIASEAPMQVEDRVGRALGTARGARLLALDEALSVLSSLRLGVSQGMLEQFSIQRLNDVFLGCQNAHIEMKRGHECDELTLNIERADLFRARFA